MTRIGFAYNLKPDGAATAAARPTDAAGGEDAEVALGDEEPPSSRTGVVRGAGDRGAVPVMVAEESPDDEFAEWDTPETIDAVAAALSAFGSVVHLEATAEFPTRLQAERPDIVFNMAEGRRGKNREAHVPAICEFFDIPYSGSDPFTLSLCLDKGRTKEILTHYGVATPAFAIVDRPEALEQVPATLRGPLFIKPMYEGSSKGITERNFCATPGELAEQVMFLLETYAQPVLVEEFLPGAEYTCAILGNGRSARVLPIVGLNFAALPAGSLPVYGFEAKWLWDRPEEPLDIFECPAQMPATLRRRIESTVLDAYRALGCRDWSRVDVRLDADGVPNVIEVNPLPGILPNPADNSCFPKAAWAAGLSYDRLIQRCLTLAAERTGVRLGRGRP